MQQYVTKQPPEKERTPAVQKKAEKQSDAPSGAFSLRQGGGLNFGLTNRLQPLDALADPSQGVVQRWKSQSLEEETNPHTNERRRKAEEGEPYDERYSVQDKYTELRDMALFNAQQEFAEDIDEYSADDELAEYLSDKEKADLFYYGKFSKLREEGMASTIHHMLSRKKLNDFYDSLTEDQKKDIPGIFKKDGDSSGNPREILLSLRSNLVLGPDCANRTDDPARKKPVKGQAADDFDPTGGDYAGISALYAKASERIDEYMKPQAEKQQDFFSEVVSLLSQAEEEYAKIQKKKGQDPDRLNLDIEDLWEADPQKKGSFRKKF